MSHPTEPSPRFRLTPSGKGWYKRIPGIGTKWIASFGAAPTGADADDIFVRRFASLADQRPVNRDAISVADLLNLWIDDRLAARDAGKLSPRTFQENKRTCAAFLGVVGRGVHSRNIGPDHFAKYLSTIRAKSTSLIANHVNTIRAAFKWACAMEYVDAARFGPSFRAPSQRERRVERAKRPGDKDYDRGEIEKLIAAAGDRMYAWILLALNGGLGNSDIARLAPAHVHADRLIFPRGKTGIDRTIPLWPETLAALPDVAGNWLFPNERGGPVESGNTHGHVSRQFGALCAAAGVANRGFYSLRRTFATIAVQTGDVFAVESIMGHASNSMTRRYVQRIDFGKLVAVTDHVREVLSIKHAVSRRPHSTPATASPLAAEAAPADASGGNATARQPSRPALGQGRTSR